MQNLTASLEDYLEIIFNHTCSSNKVRAVDIANNLNISRASVTEALKKLANKGYLNYEHYGSMSLTEAGLKVASNISHKHKTLHTFFEKVLELDSQEASENACRIEHVISDNALKSIEKIVKNTGD